MRAVKYFVTKDMYLEDRDPEKILPKDSWAVVYKNQCVGKDLKLSLEPMPSSRTDKFLANNRFSLNDAQDIAMRFMKENKINDVMSASFKKTSW